MNLQTVQLRMSNLILSFTVCPLSWNYQYNIAWMIHFVKIAEINLVCFKGYKAKAVIGSQEPLKEILHLPYHDFIERHYRALCTIRVPCQWM